MKYNSASLSRWVFVPMAALLLSACGADASCDDWKEAHCRYLERCDDESYSDCMSQLSGLECQSGAKLNECVDTLEKTCGEKEVPDSCTSHGVANTTVPAQKCKALSLKACESFTECGVASSVSGCVADVYSILDCDEAVSTSSNYDFCMEAFEGSCRSALPESCIGVIIL